jgi:hypothetical protein
MKKIIYGENSNHPHIAGSLNNIALIYSELEDSNNALNYSI